MRLLSQFLRRLFTREIRPTGDRANADLVHEMMLELEDPRPNPLLLNIATGFPSALLCVLGAGVLAGALAGREVSVPSVPALVAQAVPAATMVSAHAPAQTMSSVLAGRHLPPPRRHPAGAGAGRCTHEDAVAAAAARLVGAAL